MMSVFKHKLYIQELIIFLPMMCIIPQTLRVVLSQLHNLIISSNIEYISNIQLSGIIISKSTHPNDTANTLLVNLYTLNLICVLFLNY